MIGKLCPVTYLWVEKNRNGKDMSTGFMTLKETAEKWGIVARRINTLCAEERIPGATKIGNMWVLLENAEKPKDERIKSGRYIKNKIQMASEKY